MIVLKIGGTSMGDAKRMDGALDIARRQIERAPVMVCSAMGGVTDRIIDCYKLAQDGRWEETADRIETMRNSHEVCAREFLTGDFLLETVEKITGLFGQLTSLLKGVSLLQECSPRSADALLSFGERLSTELICARARQRGMDADLLDARQFIVTDENFNSARPIINETDRLIQAAVRPKPGRLLITQGFIGSSRDGVTTTLGRGGSDYSASIIGAALDAEEIQIWTDVDGIMTCDPRLVPEASTIPEITYAEAGELAFFGAKVVHPATIQPAVAKKIPVLVKNTGRSESPGTRIADGGAPGLKAISVKKNITVVSIASSRMLEAHGFLKRIFAIFDAAETPVDLVSTSEVSVSMTIEKTDALPAILKELDELGQAAAERDQAILCLVGRGLWKDSAFPARVFDALDQVPVRMISLGASDINLSLVVPSDCADTALRQLHERFFR